MNSGWNPPPGNDPPTAEVPALVEHLFRHESARMVATLTRIFGVEHLGLAEDVVQEALARAMQTWPFHGIPQNPAAWIMRASRNLALDVVRREKVFRDKQADIIRHIDPPALTMEGSAFAEPEIADDRLRLMFVCCHPRVPIEDQVALALKTLGGFSPAEIASALLTSEAAILKRLTRAKGKLRESGIRFEIPEGVELERRLDGVLQTLYLMFNEGYKASDGDRLIRKEVCDEAIRLTTLLSRHPAGNHPRTHALLALMLLGAARFPARVDGDGNLLRLQDQDRALWDGGLIAGGLRHLAQSAAGSSVSSYHIEAGIAACHCTAPDYASTDWPRILGLYDQLAAMDASPIVALNRAVAVAEVHGPQAGIEAVNSIAGLQALQSYPLLHAVRGELEFRLGRTEAAAAQFRDALRLTRTRSEQAFLARRLNACTTPSKRSTPTGQSGPAVSGNPGPI